ncbi:B96 [Murid betaherpesvirus 8]|uniref:B96 n=2 Tax=Rat cytomegalovirus (isolate England) TaxID=1261657 RepID=K7XY19_RCMVE|nr:E96 [Murid betaherpesvirus 8]AKE44264.1 a96 [Rat cytomegalovirus ALL-03]AFX83410.1 E96 [Murid betaherpesvirus 8]AKB93290.1 B96 [Murid betaherpesvirus 8]WPH25005.1 B96 [Murid betaherpesvirus 8]WPH25139.1 B96 [Murid betaherpesvirus 8]
MSNRTQKKMTGGESYLLMDAMRLELENRQKEFVVQAFGANHPISRIQDLRTADAKARLTIRESSRTTADVVSAIRARNAEIGGLTPRGRVGKNVDEFVDTVAEIRDETDDLREVFTSSNYDAV